MTGRREAVLLGTSESKSRTRRNQESALTANRSLKMVREGRQPLNESAMVRYVVVRLQPKTGIVGTPSSSGY